MRMTWAKRKASPSAGVDRLHFVMWDFLKMFLAAVICGVMVSLAAAGIALVLSNDANAAPFSGVELVASHQNVPTTQSDTESLGFPGLLLIGSGCDAEPLDATERDWKVTINGKHIDVRVMQTFFMPPGDAMTATFNASLPSGARLLRLNVHTSGRFWQGKVMDAESVGHLTAVDFRQLSRRGMLVVQNDDGDISTEAIINIAATEAVTIEYTYRTLTDVKQPSRSLFVALANDKSMTGEMDKTHTPASTVWVEWVENNPSQLTLLPGGAFLETAEAKISGLSWTNSQRKADTRFHLAWSM